MWTTARSVLMHLCLFWAAVMSAPCHAQEAAPAGLTAGSVLVRGRLIGMIPYDQHSQIAVIGGKIDAAPMVLPDADLSYFITDHVALSGETGALKTSITARDTLIGRLPIGSVWSVPLMATAQYHFSPESRFNPYVGAGVYASFYFGEHPAGGYVPKFSVSPEVGTMLQAGFDYHIAGNWYANLDFRQIFLPTQSIRNGSLGGAKVGLDVAVIGAGIGYRF